MNKIVRKTILVSLLTIAFVPTRCEGTQQQVQEINDTTLRQQELRCGAPQKLEALYALGWLTHGKCRNLGDKREELLEAGFLLTYEEAMKMYNALYYDILTILSLISGVVSSGSCVIFMICGSKIGFEKTCFSNVKATVADCCLWAGITFILSYIAGKYYWKCFDKAFLEADKVANRLAKERLEYCKKKEKEGIHFCIGDYI